MSTTNNQQFFSTTKRGEISEWKDMLSNEKEATRKEGVKKVIAAMTIGKDVSMLFPDVLKSIQTGNIELKKLVYLYIMNYAKSNPDLAMLAVNTFVNDSKHDNPLVRALAVRTMGCIRVNKIIDYLAEPLQRTLQDKDPYVRKTAAIAVAKLYDLNPELTIEKGFITDLEKLLTDQNPMVIANTVASLSEILESSKGKIVEFNQRTVNTLLTALNDCTEWGQIFILDALVQYEPPSEKEAAQIIERVTPRLAHVNSGVVLSACKIILKMINKVKDPESQKNFAKKLSAPLVTLLNSKPEIQYVALRNISLIVQKRPAILGKDFKVFFCKYNDPIYVKLEKLDILVKLASERNIDTILLEFQEYSSEVDVQFVRRAVRAIGRCAIKLERAAQRCIDVLLELIKTKVNYVVQEAIIVIKDIFRKYPNKYEGIIGTLCENLDTLDEPEAKASMIWIIGEYAERIENADELLEVFVDAFHDESTQVQLQLLTSCVKLYLKRPDVAEKLVKHVLTLATKESDNPDLRDRGYVYYRLLTVDANVAKNIVLGEKPVLSDEATHLSSQLLNELHLQIGTLSSVYHKPPELFVPDYNKKIVVDRDDNDEERDEEVSREELPSTVPGDDKPKGMISAPSLLDFGYKPTPKVEEKKATVSFDDLFGGSSHGSVVTKTTYNTLLTAQQGKGLQVEGFIGKKGESTILALKFTNSTNDVINGMAVKFNKNAFCLVPAGGLPVSQVLPGQSAECELELVPKGPVGDKISNVIQVALKTNQTGILYFQDTIKMSNLFVNEKVSKEEYIGLWKSLPDDKEHQMTVPSNPQTSPEQMISKLETVGLYFMAKVALENIVKLYFFCKFHTLDGPVAILAEISVSQSRRDIVQLSSKTAETKYLQVFEAELSRILQE
jgi:AP-1 complex subunit beta-1